MAESDGKREDEQTTDLAELAEFVERMIAVAQQSGTSMIAVETDDLKLKIKSGGTGSGGSRSISRPAAEPEQELVGPVTVDFEGHLITAPMVGTFYHSTSPADPPLVQIGDRVETGQLIGVIEAMKIMNEITADRSGTVIEVIAPNATAVEYGSPLIRLSA